MHTDNEDRVVVGKVVLTSTSGVEHTILSTAAVIAVLDGLGGHPAGDVASDRAAHVIAEADPPIDEAATSALLGRADSAIHDAAREHPTYRGMGTTVAMISLLDDRAEAIVANVGDSLVFMLANGSLTDLATSDRGAGGGLWQCLGVNEGADVTPHISRIEVARGDRFLLASDGLTDVVPRATLEATLRDDPDRAVSRLLAKVEDAGSPDDVAIAVVEVLGI